MSLYTKDELTRLYHAWGKPAAKIPTAKAVTVLTFPPTADFQVVTVSKSDRKSTDRKTLYDVKFENPAPAANP